MISLLDAEEVVESREDWPPCTDRLDCPTVGADVCSQTAKLGGKVTSSGSCGALADAVIQGPVQQQGKEG